MLEAQERAHADARLYEAQRDEASSEIQDFLVQAKVQESVLALLRDSILPRTRETLELSRSDYAKGNVDYATVLSALREVLQVQLQLAQVDGELGKAIAGLERAVGRQINEAPARHHPRPPRPARSTSSSRAIAFPTAPPAADQLPTVQCHSHPHERRRRQQKARRLIEGITERGRHDALAL